MPLDDSSHRYLTRSYETVGLPRGWRKHPFKIQGANMRCYEFGNPNAPLRIAHTMGFKSSAMSSMKRFEMLCDDFASMVVFELPDPDKSLEFMDQCDAIVNHALFDPSSPVFNINTGTTEIVGLTHSTSGVVVENHLLDPFKRNFAEQRFNGFLHAAPAFDIAHASQRFHPRSDKVHDWHAGRNSDVYVGDALLDKAYLKARGQKSLGYGDGEYPPTHGQAKAIKNYARSYQERALAVGNQSTLRRHIAIGDADLAVCYKTAKFMGNALGIEPEIMPGKGHFLLSDDHSFIATARDRLLSFMRGAPPGLLPDSVHEDFMDASYHAPPQTFEVPQEHSTLEIA